MNIEQLEALLTELDKKQVVLVAPSFGQISYSYAGILSVVASPNFTVGFHLTNPIGGVAVIFFAEDVVAVENPTLVCKTHIIRLKGPHQYPEKYSPVDYWKK